MIHQPIEHGEGSRSVAFPGFVLGLLLFALAPTCGEAPPSKGTTRATRTVTEDGVIQLAGPTMGTSWSASLHHADESVVWEAILQAKLDEIEGALTTWDPNSELMRFNRWEVPSMEVKFEAGEHLANCYQLGSELHTRTGRAFDPTVLPLVRLWGFVGDRDRPMPTDAQIEEAREQSRYFGILGYGDDPPKHQIPKVPGLELDFSGLAKGYAADQLAALAQAQGCAGGLIEVGGEIRVFGARQGGGPWRVGIEAPAEHPGAPKVIGSVLAIDAGSPLQAVATSGDSRNRRTVGDFTFSHILDPRTGRPLVDPPASVTVVAPDCATADAWATALLVLGPEQGLPRAAAAGLEVCFQIRQEDGSFREVATPAYLSELLVERL